MRKFFRALEVICIMFFIVWFIILFIENSSKNREVNKQEEIIHMYETTFVHSEEGNLNRIFELESQLEASNKRIAELEQQVNGITEDNVYISLKFSTDGNYYKEAYDKIEFYKDPECTIKIFNVRFMSSAVDYGKAENGLEIYFLRMDNGEICYCTERPYLITEKKYKEMHNKK